MPSTESLGILQQQISGSMSPDRRGRCSSLHANLHFKKK